MFNKKNNLKAVLSISLMSLLLSTGCSKKVSTIANPLQQTPQGTVQTDSSYYNSGTYDSNYGSTVDPNNISTQQNNLPTGSVTGRVFDSLTGMGLSGAKVEVMGIMPILSTTTNASGNFTLPNVPQGRQVLIVTKTEYTNLGGNSNIVVNASAGNTVTAPNITLVPDRASMANGFVKAFDGFKHPRGIAYDRDNGNLYVVDVIGLGGVINYDRAEVKKINLDGGILDTFGSRIDFGSIDLFRLLQRSTGVGVDAGGNVYVADTGNNCIKKYGPNGKYLLKTKDLKDVFDLAVMTSGNIVASVPGSSKISIFDTSMNIKMENILGGAASDGVRGITTDNGDNIYIIDTAARPGEVIKKFDKNGNRLNLNFGIIGGLEPSYFNNPTDIAVDNRNGDIYVVDTGNNRVQRFSSEGVFLSEFGQFGSENGSFNSPWGIAIDNQGFVYISDSKNSRLQKFMPGRYGVDQNN